MVKRLIGLARPAIITRRRLITGAAAVTAMAALPREARAVPPTVFDQSINGSGAYMKATNGGLSAERMMWWSGYAVDVPNNLAWYYNSATGKWMGAVLASQDPATGTGGLGVSFMSSKYPMWHAYKNRSYERARLVDNPDGARLAIPSGFSTLRAANGGLVTWNPSDKSSVVSLSESNAVAAHDGGSNDSWQGVRASAALPSAKVYWELEHYSVAGQHYAGIAGSGANLANPGTGDNAALWHMATGEGTIYGNGTSFLGSLSPGDYTGASATGLFSNGKSSGKWFVEVYIDLIQENGSVRLGWGNPSASPTQLLGENTNSYGMLANGSRRCDSTNLTPTGGELRQGDHVILAVDTGAKACYEYVYSSSLPGFGWINGDPVAGTGGYSCSAMSGPFHTGFSATGSDGSYVTINDSGVYYNSAAAASLLGAGWNALNPAPSSGGPRGRVIFGQNSPARDAFRALLTA